MVGRAHVEEALALRLKIAVDQDLFGAAAAGLAADQFVLPALAEALGIAGVVSAAATPADAHHSGDAPIPELAVALAQIRPDLILAPIGLTGTPAAQQITAALDELELPRLRWVDLPYGLSRTPGGPLGEGEVVAIPIGDQIGAKRDACASLGLTTGPSLLSHATSEGERLGVDVPVEVLLRPL